MRAEIGRGERLRPQLDVAPLVGQDRREEPRCPLHTHTYVERTTAIPVLHPRVKFAQTQGFLGLRDRAPADAGEDELVPEFVELAEFGVFPRLFTS